MKFGTLLLVLSLFLLFSGCSRIDIHYTVLQGNYRYTRGEFQESLWSYLKASGEGVWEDRIRYNLGNVYHRLGEEDSALQQWHLAEETADVETSYRISFNRGVLYYEQGSFQEAYEAFRKALEFDSTSIDAKINLEHALRKVNRKRQEGEAESVDGEGSPEGEPERILEYIRRNESRTWISSPRGEEEEEGNQW